MYRIYHFPFTCICTQHLYIDGRYTAPQQSTGFTFYLLPTLVAGRVWQELYSHTDRATKIYLLHFTHG